MSRRQTRLATVLRLRALNERRARGALSQAEMDLDARRREFERRQSEPPVRPPSEVLTPLQLRILALQGVRSQELLLEAAAEQERAQLRRAEAHEQWSQASIEHKSTERLQERRQAETALQARMAAERVLDELVVLRRERRR